MVKIIIDLIPKGRRNRPGYPMEPLYLTIHSTANTAAGADAAAHAVYIKSDACAARPASWHFTVDGGTKDGKQAPAIYQHLPLNENGWHAGDGTNGTGNRKSIGIEICENRDGNRAQAIRTAAWLCAKLIREVKTLKPFPEVLKQHFDWSGKNCPRILRTGNKWADFLRQVEGCAGGYTVQREIAVYVNGQKVDEVGLLINNATRLTAGFVASLTGGTVSGYGDHICFNIPDLAAKVATLEEILEEIKPLVEEIQEKLA